MLIFLNSPILSNWGEFRFSRISQSEAATLWNNTDSDNKISACGHASTTNLLKKLGFNIDENRIQVIMKSGDKAIVIKIKKRLDEGILLSEEDFNSIEFEFGLLECIKTIE